MAISRAAAEGFGRAAGEYERARPGYPSAVIDLLAETGGLDRGRLVVDLAAGTGKLTRLLGSSGATVIAVEPVAAMAESLVGTRLITAATAEALPLRTEVVDLLTAAQAFHWFDAAAAMDEVRRVVRPGGWLAVLWNERDESVSWVRSLGHLMERHGGGLPYARRVGDFGALLRGAGLRDVTRTRFDNPLETTRRGVVERAASTSYIAALPEERREVALAEVATLVEGLPEPFGFPHVTDVHLARLPGP